MKVLCQGLNHFQRSGVSKEGKNYNIDQIELHCVILDKTRSQEFSVEFGKAVYKFIVPMSLYEELKLPEDFSRLKDRQLDITFIPSYNGRMSIDSITVL